MTDPERWLETGERGLAQHLLRAALTDVAPDAVRLDVLEAVNGALPKLPPTPDASPPHAEGGPSVGPGAGVGPGGLARVAVAGAVAHPAAASTLVALVITLGAVAHYAIQGAPRSERTPASPTPSLAPAPPGSAELEPPKHSPRSEEDTSHTSPTQLEPPAQSERPSTPARRGAPRSRLAHTATPPQDHLGEQLTLLARARQHLRTGKPDAALTVLAAFERQFPEGALIPEVTVLRHRAQRQVAQNALPSGERRRD